MNPQKIKAEHEANTNRPNDRPVKSERQKIESAERPAAPSALRRRLRTTIVILEVAFVAVLLALGMTSHSIHHSRSLWVLFFYCFPSQFLVTAIPHEPVLLFFGKYFAPLTVALVAALGTLIIETINVSVINYIADFRAFKKIAQSRVVVKLAALFQKAPFLSLWIAGFLPIPFYPFRFLVVIARYPLALFALAVVTSRMPRFYLLALLGKAFNIPNAVILGLFAVLALAAVLPFLRKTPRKGNLGTDPASP